MSLPLLPGNTFSSNPGRENFSKSHHFDVCNAINMNVGEYKVSDPRTHYYPRLPILWTTKDGRELLDGLRISDKAWYWWRDSSRTKIQAAFNLSTRRRRTSTSMDYFWPTSPFIWCLFSWNGRSHRLVSDPKQFGAKNGNGEEFRGEKFWARNLKREQSIWKNIEFDMSKSTFILKMIRFKLLNQQKVRDEPSSLWTPSCERVVRSVRGSLKRQFWYPTGNSYSTSSCPNAATLWWQVLYFREF